MFQHRLRHFGYGGVSAERDVNGMLWECVTADLQAAGIRQTWSSMSYRLK